MSAGLWALVAVFVIGGILRVPIALAMLAAGIAYLWTTGQDIGLAVDQIMNQMFGMYVLLAVPMFILAANVMNAATISDRLWSAAEVFVGRLRGGLAHVTILVSVVFSGISGSAVTDAAGPGMLAIRMMRDVSRYPAGFSAALVAAASTIAPIIPPSIPMVLFGVSAEVSIGELFISGFGPGLLIGGALMGFVHLYCRWKGWGLRDGDGRLPVGRATVEAGWALLMPVIILGGIYTGTFTPTESAAVAVAVALGLGFAQKTIGWKDVPAMLATSARVCGVILPIIAVALLFAQALTVLDIPQKFVAFVMSFGVDRTSVIVLMLLIWIVSGMFMEASPNIVVLGPLLLPLAQKVGIDPIHFCVFMITTLGLGFITPPFGLNLFVMSGLTRTPVTAIAREALPFVLAMVVVSTVIGFVPELSLFSLRR